MEISRQGFVFLMKDQKGENLLSLPYFPCNYILIRQYGDYRLSVGKETWKDDKLGNYKPGIL